MPYDDGSRSVMDHLRAALKARKAQDDYAHRAAYNRACATSYKAVGTSHADVYAERARDFDILSGDLAKAADACSNDALTALMTGDYYDRDEWDIKRAV